MIDYKGLRSTRAFDGVVFDAEKRLEIFIEGAEADANKIKNICFSAGISPDFFLNKHYKLCTAYLNSQSRCISSAITGRSNFPVARMVKQTGFAMAHLNRLQRYINNIENIVKRIAPKTETTEEKIKKLQSELEAAEKWQETIKITNNLLRAGKRTTAISILGGEELLINNKRVWGTELFRPFTMKNNLAKIKRLQISLKCLQLAAQQTGFLFTDGKVEYNAQERRWNIFFNKKPIEEIRINLKRKGFKWSFSRKAWTRIALTMSQNKLAKILER